METSRKRPLSIGIVGGGFSGLAVAANLVFKAKTPFHITLIEATDNFAKGVGFSTIDPLHLLNVRASHMGAFPEDPEGFYHWLQRNTHLWREAHPRFRDLEVKPHHFLPRMIYALYLADIAAQLRSEAEKNRIVFSTIRAQALDIQLTASDILQIGLSSGDLLPVDRVVLAMGILPTKSLPFETPVLLRDPRYIGNVWDPPAKSIICSDRLHNEKILIIGTGLTMVDAITSLVERGHTGSILAISTKGLLTETHLSDVPTAQHTLHLNPSSSSLRALVRQTRQEIADASQEGRDWRLVIDALRPHMQTLWRKQSLEDKKRFLKYLVNVWNTHRHRMAPASNDILQRLFKQSRLEIRAGQIQSIDYQDPSCLRVSFRMRGEQKLYEVQVDHVINCSGPEYALAKQKNPLLKGMLEQGLVKADALGLGLALNADGYVEGTAPGQIYALGALLFGERFETTAVPEIRQQAADIAHRILETINFTTVRTESTGRK